MIRLFQTNSHTNSEVMYYFGLKNISLSLFSVADKDRKGFFAHLQQNKEQNEVQFLRSFAISVNFIVFVLPQRLLGNVTQACCLVNQPNKYYFQALLHYSSKVHKNFTGNIYI